MIPVAITTGHIPLAAFLKFAGAVMSGGRAKMLIRGGGATVNGEPCLQAGRKLRNGDVVRVGDTDYEVVAVCT